MTLAVLVLCASGCIPHVLHGPRVEEGVTGQLSLTLGRNTEWGSGGEFRVLPSLYVGARRAHVSSRVSRSGGSLAFSYGVQVPALLLPVFFDAGGLDAVLATSHADVYVQPNRRAEPGSDGGIGALFSTHIFAPYIQFGRLNAEGDGWYTTQLAAFARTSGPRVLYMPALAYRDHDEARNHTANWSLGAGFALDDGDTEWIVLLGGTFELGRRR
ncbi:MAG TPA: hypothetical protein VMN60_05390 [Longimicrobiales bacterium]|nr:hypothetical protein [Longimicrobiales bacterium]